MNPLTIFGIWCAVAVPAALAIAAVLKACAAQDHVPTAADVVALDLDPDALRADDELLEHLRCGGPPTDDELERALAGWRDEAQDGT